jgi:biopolymer transport protein ExbD
MTMRREKREQKDADLNIVPIIDCFTVMIAFLLVSASFLSIGFFDAGVAASAAGADEKQTPASIEVHIQLKDQQIIELKVSGKTRHQKLIQPVDSEWNREELVSSLVTLKNSWPDLNVAFLDADDNVAYRDIIITMDQTRQVLPEVLLGGF